MPCNRLAAFLTLTHALLGVAAGPLAAKRQDGATASVRSVASVGIIADGSTTYEVFAPTSTPAPATRSAQGSIDASVTATPTEPSKTTLTFSPTGETQPPSTAFPPCSKDPKDANPFCLPKAQATLYYGKTYYATWDAHLFASNSTVEVQLHLANHTDQQVWSSGKIANMWGFVAVDTQKEWMQGYSMYNLTFTLRTFDAAYPQRPAITRDGPQITLTNEPPNHYKAPGPTKLHKEGLLIGLPVTLGALVLIMLGLWIGMRKHRTIGLGNIMGRRKGYGVGKSRRQRMGFTKKKGGAIRLEEREEYPRPQYQNAHSKGDSLGSLVSDDGIRSAPGDNHFKSEIERQKTGR